MDPPLAVTVPKGWEALHLSPSFFDAGREVEGLFSAVMFFRPAVVVGAAGGEPAATPEEAVALLRQNDGLTVLHEKRVRMLGLDGIQIDLVAAHEDTQILGEGAALLGIGPDSDLRLTFLSAADGILVVGLLSPAGELEAWVRSSKPVVDSIRLVP